MLNRIKVICIRVLFATLISVSTLVATLAMLYISKIAFEVMFGPMFEFARGIMHMIMLIDIIIVLFFFFFILLMDLEKKINVTK